MSSPATARWIWPRPAGAPAPCSGASARAGTTADNIRREKQTPLFRAFADEYLRRCDPHWKPSGRKTVRIYLKARILPTFGRMPLDRIGPEDVAAWFDAASRDKPGAASLDLDDLFLFEAKRRVMKDRTVSLHGRLYEVDAVLVGETVTLRYDPDAPPARPIEVVHDAKPAGLATHLDAYANTRVKRHRPSWQLQCDTPAREPNPSPLAMRNLKEKK